MNPRHPAGIREAERRGRFSIGPSTERPLVDRARLGDLGAFEQLVRSRMDTVYRLAHAITGDEAEAADAAQETFVAAWQQLPKLREPDRFDAWLARIAVNEARMVVRARRRRRVREIPAGRLTTDFEAPAPLDDGARLAEALDRLSTDQRALLALHHLEGRSVAELADLFDIPAGTVKSRLFTARRALDAALGAAGEDQR